MKLSRNFWKSEFDCKDGTPYPEEWIEDRLLPLVKALQKIRTASGSPIHITSAYRTPSHNRRVGGSRRSQHLRGLAADMSPRDISAAELYRIVIKLIKEGKIPDGGVGKYKTFVHYDQRGYRARW